MSKEKNLTAVMKFHGVNIYFEEIEGKIMINATQMAKPFGRNTKDWLKTQQSKDLIKTVSDRRKILSADLQIVKKGGKNQGTWLQKDVALFFAQWLSPEFYFACNLKLEELLREQALSLPPKNGVFPMLHNGKLYYPYKDVMQVLGGIARSNASRRKRKYPNSFVKVFGRNFITEEYFDLLKNYYDYKNGINQLKLSL